MDENVEQEDGYFKRHKKAYLWGGGMSLAVITCLIMRGRIASIQEVLGGSDEITVRPLTFLSKEVSTTTMIDQSKHVVNVLEREGRGHPGYIVRCVETGLLYLSQKSAAEELNIPAWLMSDHLNGKLPDAHGWHLERVGITA